MGYIKIIGGYKSIVFNSIVFSTFLIIVYGCLIRLCSNGQPLQVSVSKDEFCVEISSENEIDFWVFNSTTGELRHLVPTQKQGWDSNSFVCKSTSVYNTSSIRKVAEDLTAIDLDNRSPYKLITEGVYITANKDGNLRSCLFPLSTPPPEVLKLLRDLDIKLK